MQFEFATANRILFGPGVVSRVPELASRLGHQVLVVASSAERSTRLVTALSAVGLEVVLLNVNGEPNINSVIMATRTANEMNAQIVIGMGGGSILDTGKAAAVMATNSGGLLDYLEVVGAGQVLQKQSLPYIAIPTTAGTGSEVTRNAVIAVPEKKVKVSLRSPFMLPVIAAVDPELTYDLPAEITATTGLDALTQLIEPFVCNSPTPLTDALCREGLVRVARSLDKAYHFGLDIGARQDMSLASLFGGLALANARLGAVHGLAGPIGGMFQAPHGAICARLLPFVIETNIQTLRARQPDSPAIERYTEVARLLTGNDSAQAEDSASWVIQLCKLLSIRPLAEYGISAGDFPELIAQSQKASSMKGNPIQLTDAEISRILSQAI